MGWIIKTTAQRMTPLQRLAEILTLHVCVRALECVRVCVCVCVREKERGRESEREETAMVN